MAKTPADFVGTYLGLVPGDDDEVGEIEIVITPEKITARMADGIGILVDHLDVSDFVPMTEKEIARILVGVGAAIRKGTTAFRTRGGFPQLHFIEGEGPRLLAFGDDELPATLFDSAQVANGYFDRTLAAAEAAFGKGSVFRLRNDGKAEE